jgi:hypothetical protein
VSSFNSVEKRLNEAGIENSNGLLNYTNVSQIPIGQVRSYVFDCDQIIKKLIEELDDNLLKVNINAYVSVDMENAHKAVWQDAQ